MKKMKSKINLAIIATMVASFIIVLPVKGQWTNWPVGGNTFNQTDPSLLVESVGIAF